MKHEFALYVASLSAMSAEIVVDDPLLVQRIKIILRLEVGQSCIFFDQLMYARATITHIGKKSIVCSLGQKQANVALEPSITFLLPILKKEAFAEAVYSLAEIGANNIQLVTTQKVQRHWSASEMERLNKIVIAAAEQSKNFAFPAIKSPVSLEKALTQLPAQVTKLFFDAAGKPFIEGMDVFTQSKKELVLLVGPEGDLAPQEKELVCAQGFQTYALTPTIMRAQQAAAVSLALMRTICNK